MKKNFKKYLLFFLSLIFLYTGFTPSVYAKDMYINAISSIALDCETKIVLYEKNAYNPIEIASTTKIITALVAIKSADINKKVIISEKAASVRGSEIGLRQGEEITLKELLYGLMLRSGNDAAIAIAEGVSGSVPEFLKLMNEYALEIGLLNSNFESPHGLDSENHYSTAYDLALVTAKAKELKLFNEIVSCKDIDAKQYNFTRSYHNINKILWLMPNATGVKTGFTGKAGKCLVTSVKIQNRDVIIITLNCTPRWEETKKISEFIDKNYTYKKLISKDEPLENISILDGTNSVEVISKKDIIVPVKNDVDIQVKVNKPLYDVYAPIEKGVNLGRVDIYGNNKLLYTTGLVTKSTVDVKKNFMKNLFKNRK